jgi:hypothetical protein
MWKIPQKRPYTEKIVPKSEPLGQFLNGFFTLEEKIYALLELAFSVWAQNKVFLPSLPLSRIRRSFVVFFYGPPRVPRCCRPLGKVRPLR